MNKWYFSKDNTITEPMDFESAKKYVVANLDSYGWQQSYAQWLPVHCISDFADIIPSIKPLAVVPQGVVDEFNNKSQKIVKNLTKVNADISNGERLLEMFAQEIDTYKQMTLKLSPEVQANINGIEQQYNSLQQQLKDIKQTTHLTANEVSQVVTNFNLKITNKSVAPLTSELQKSIAKQITKSDIKPQPVIEDEIDKAIREKLKITLPDLTKKPSTEVKLPESAEEKMPAPAEASSTEVKSPEPAEEKMPAPAEASSTEVKSPEPAEETPTKAKLPESAEDKIPAPAEAASTEVKSPEPAEASSTEAKLPAPAEAASTEAKSPEPAEAASSDDKIVNIRPPRPAGAKVISTRSNKPGPGAGAHYINRNNEKSAKDESSAIDTTENGDKVTKTAEVAPTKPSEVVPTKSSSVKVIGGVQVISHTETTPAEQIKKAAELASAKHSTHSEAEKIKGKIGAGVKNIFSSMFSSEPAPPPISSALKDLVNKKEEESVIIEESVLIDENEASEDYDQPIRQKRRRRR